MFIARFGPRFARPLRRCSGKAGAPKSKNPGTSAARESPSRQKSKQALLDKVAKMTATAPPRSVAPTATEAAALAAARVELASASVGDDVGEDRDRSIRGLKLRALIAALVTVALAATVWSKLRKKQMSGWARRVLDTYHLLDSAETLSLEGVVEAGTTERDDVIFRSMRSAFAQKSLTIATLNVQRFAAPWGTAGIDVASIFAEGSRGSETVPTVEVAHGLSQLRILSAASRDRLYGIRDDVVHSRTMALLEWTESEPVAAAAGEVGEVAERSVARSEVLAWTRAAARIGLVRHNHYGSSGGLLKMEFVATNLTESIAAKCAVEEEVVVGKGTRLKRQCVCDALLPALDYSMFIARNRPDFSDISAVRNSTKMRAEDWAKVGEEEVVVEAEAAGEEADDAELAEQ